VSLPKRIVIVQGHPDPEQSRFCRALEESYVLAARAAGHVVHTVDVARLEFPLLRSKEDFEKGEPPAAIQMAQQELLWAQHIVLIYPLCLGDAPALLKGFLEQLFRPGFAFKAESGHGLPKKLLKGRSARVVVTMGMPALFYRWYFGAHSLKNLKRNVLAFSGFKPVSESIVGFVESKNPAQRQKWLARMAEFGSKGA